MVNENSNGLSKAERKAARVAVALAQPLPLSQRRFDCWFSRARLQNSSLRTFVVRVSLSLSEQHNDAQQKISHPPPLSPSLQTSSSSGGSSTSSPSRSLTCTTSSRR
jgi:hypothetical protein